jgi:homoserine kinase
MEIATKASRKLLPSEVPLKVVVAQTANAAGLVAGLLTKDFGLIARSLHDGIAEPARAHTIPRFHAMQQAAIDAGALGCSISGSGPAVFALAQDEHAAARAIAAMSRVLNDGNVEHTKFTSRINPAGAMIIDRGPSDTLQHR